jgi:hypothetical protein
MTDVLLRKAHAGRAGVQGDNDYDVIGTDGMVIGRIFEATTSPAGTPLDWRSLTGTMRTERYAMLAQGHVLP